MGMTSGPWTAIPPHTEDDMWGVYQRVGSEQVAIVHEGSDARAIAALPDLLAKARALVESTRYGVLEQNFLWTDLRDVVDTLSDI